MNTPQCRLCLIEDDEVMGGALTLRFELEGYAFDWFKTAREALAALKKRRYGAVISDIRLPDLSGEALYTRLLDEGGALPPFIFVTGFGAVDQAVRLIKLGAADYLLKPFEPDALLAKVRLLTACTAPGQQMAADGLGVSPAMRALEEMLPRIAGSQASVLITGESGVGKERLARKLHRLAGEDRPFVAVNCGALTESLLEAELFGFEKGAFTGAVKAKRGLFEQAHGGTLFLDEIGETSPAMQVKLLRAIQEREIVRVGGETATAVDIRLIAATNQDLRALTEQGQFREDLYYRLNVIQLKVPPLRERREDILWLAGRLLDAQAEEQGSRRKLLSPAAEQALTEYPWPGNVRELKHTIERACILTDGPMLTPEDLFEETIRPICSPKVPECRLSDYLAECERTYISRALESRSWQIQETAGLLGISRKNLWEKMKRLGIRRGDEAEEAD
ncbi:two component Fis family sigma54 specific transcriptional regulator [Sulfuritortus calidifontis]|uniref:Two component Fis family sigma54 specific transcriptional regulator n=1 Tax=Sulfuritortus calidifontis TaxID=1914471 RepID=A0A4R3JXA6_9PROT|nr:sigma-54 dependent transcriptional regulator [Sulfuritortus calidifontis]TCS71760.1 two component Fis family sigma54 specific transcriptional regulator [Sulfuritortus calidifontis]